MDKPMMWIAYDPSDPDQMTNREQFNGDRPAWGESMDEHLSKLGVDVPMVGDVLELRMGFRRVVTRRLTPPERNEHGYPASPWYWTIIVEKP